MREIPTRILEAVGQYALGKEEQLRLLVVALLAGGHVLVEGPPGTGKTLMARSFAQAIGGQFKRVQLTPDMLPSDATGFNLYRPALPACFTGLLYRPALPACFTGLMEAQSRDVSPRCRSLHPPTLRGISLGCASAPDAPYPASTPSPESPRCQATAAAALLEPEKMANLAPGRGVLHVGFGE